MKTTRKRDRIPTALSFREISALQRFAQGYRVTECGSLLGYSTLVLADVALEVVSIDRHEGYGPSTYRQFMSNIDGEDNIVPIVGDAARIVRSIDTDRYFVDLDGTYETTLGVLSAIPYRGSRVAVHDFRRVNCAGVERAIIDSGFRVIELVDTLAVCARD